MWYLALRRNLQPREAWTVGPDEHLAWMREQHERGSILLSGPSVDRSLGMYLIRADSRAAAKQIAASDPFTAAGHCAFDLIDWEIHQALGIGPFSEAAFRASKRRRSVVHSPLLLSHSAAHRSLVRYARTAHQRFGSSSSSSLKLKQGVTREQLLATADAVSEWAKAQPGFLTLTRDLSYSESEDRWIEVVWCRSIGDAEAAATAAQSSSRAHRCST